MNFEKLEYYRNKNNDSIKTWRCYVKNKDVKVFIEKELDEIGKEVKIDGFRKGKVNRDILKEKYEEKAFYSVVSKLIDHVSRSILKKENYDLITKVEVNFLKDLDKNKDLDLELIFCPKPDLKNFDLSKISLYVDEVDVDKKEIEKELDRIKERNIKYINRDENDQIVKDKDKVSVFFEGFLKSNNKPIQGGKSEKYDLIIGSKSFIDTFEDQIIGRKKDESFVVNVRFPESYQSKELENQEAYFNVKVLEIKKPVISEINDEILKKEGCKDIEELKNKIKEEIINNYNESEKIIKQKEIFELAIKKSNISVPDHILEKELKSRIDNLKEKEKDFDEKKFRKENKDKILYALQVFYLTQSLLNKFETKVTEEEVKTYMLQYLYSYGLQDMKRIKKELEDEERKSEIRYMLKEKKVYNELYEKCTKKKNKISKESFDKKVAKYYEDQRSNS